MVENRKIWNPKLEIVKKQYFLTARNVGTIIFFRFCGSVISSLFLLLVPFCYSPPPLNISITFFQARFLTFLTFGKNLCPTFISSMLRRLLQSCHVTIVHKYIINKIFQSFNFKFMHILNYLYVA